MKIIYLVVRTDHVLFLAAGAFHMAKPSDLIPELQGRFPLRVELDALDRDDLVRILREPENSLVRQYTALLAQPGTSTARTRPRGGSKTRSEEALQATRARRRAAY